jgi:hypothetical protein
MTRLHRPLIVAPALAIALFAHASIASAPAGRYTIANGTVTDTKTGLVRQQTISTTKYPWTSTSATTASAYCAGLRLNGTTVARAVAQGTDDDRRRHAEEPRNRRDGVPGDAGGLLLGGHAHAGLLWANLLDGPVRYRALRRHHERGQLYQLRALRALKLEEPLYCSQTATGSSLFIPSKCSSAIGSWRRASGLRRSVMTVPSVTFLSTSQSWNDRRTF